MKKLLLLLVVLATMAGAAPNTKITPEEFNYNTKATIPGYTILDHIPPPTDSLIGHLGNVPGVGCGLDGGYMDPIIRNNCFCSGGQMVCRLQ